MDTNLRISDPPKNLLYYLSKSKDYLERKKIPNPRLEAEILLAHILGIPRWKLYSQFDMPLNPTEQSQYRDLVKKRSKGVPTAYLIGKKNFYGRDFLVNESVLIPRPETEELIELAFKLSAPSFMEQKHNSLETIRILDLGCGSGCIGLTFFFEWKKVSSLPLLIDFVDVSKEALLVAKENARVLWDKELSPHNLQTQTKNNSSPLESVFQFYESDLFNQLPSNCSYHIILSNPPYVLPDEYHSLSPEVKREPLTALVVSNFQNFHESILHGAYKRLVPGGFCILETNPKMASSLAESSSQFGFIPSIYLDCSGKERFVVLRKGEGV